MSEHTTNTDRTTTEQRTTIAERFGRDLDPLAEYEEPLDELAAEGIDVFDLYVDDILCERDLKPETIRNYESVYDDWREFMAREGRQPACPNRDHVVRFIEYLCADEAAGGRGNAPQSAKGKLRKLTNAYEFFQEDAALPHPTDYNPFRQAREKLQGRLRPDRKKDPYPLQLADLREMVQSVTHLRARAIIALQLKLGLRASEVANIQLRDLQLENTELQAHYPELGTHERLGDYTNVLFVPSNEDRDGNKSSWERLLPLDGELRRVLIRYLLARPDAGEPWLFLSKKSHSNINKKVVGNEWTDAFPEYTETEQYQKLTSHFGRHFFTTYWEVQQDLNSELVGYMRGDKPGRSVEGSPMRDYLHTHYEDIEEVYRQHIFKLGI